MGYQTEEQLKILYEESLKDIRNLAARLEIVAETVLKATNTISNEKHIIKQEN